MGLFGPSKKRVVIGSTAAADKNTIVFPSDQELFPALFREGGPRLFRTRYALAIKNAIRTGSFDTQRAAVDQIAREKKEISDAEFHAIMESYRRGIRGLWLSWEGELKTEIEQGTIDSFPLSYCHYNTLKYCGYFHRVDFRYFDELHYANGRDLPAWPWFSVCEPIQLCVIKPNPKDIQRVIQQAYRMLRYYTLWDSTLPVHQKEVDSMQADFLRAMRALGVTDCSFLKQVPKLPEDLMAEAEPAMPCSPVEKTPPEQFAALREGDVLYFGSYPFASDGEKRAIEWRVQFVDEAKGHATLISSQCLDVMPVFHEDNDKITWKDSDLRRWLNEDFYRTAFTEEERRYITTTDVYYAADWNSYKGLYIQDHISLPTEGDRMRFKDKMIFPAVSLTPYAFSKMKNLHLLGYIDPDSLESGWWMIYPTANRTITTVNRGGGISDERLNRSLPVRLKFCLSFAPDPEQ